MARRERLRVVSAGQDGLDVRGVSKAYGSTLANQEIDLQVAPGTVHVLLGENGAGKSTLVNLINGREAPDAGEIRFAGALVAAPGHTRPNPAIATVHQDLALVPVMTGLENIALALRRRPDRALRRAATEIQDRLGTGVDLDRPVEELELPQRQRIELVKALVAQPRLLVLDEPTTFLPPAETGPFLELVRRLAADGLAVLMITHRLDEAQAVADSATVLRHGRVVARHAGPQLPSNAELAAQIVGTAVPEPTRPRAEFGPEVLRLAHVSAVESGRTVLDDVELSLRAGEILGLAGVDGNGQLELLEVIAGLRRCSGRIELHGEPVQHLPLRKRAGRGLHYVSGDRRRAGIVPTLTIAEHFEVVLGRAPRDLDALLRAADVRPPDPRVRADGLSGGNQQKLMMARAFQRSPAVLLVSYPTQGLDVLAAAQLRQVLIERADTGIAIVVASGDLDELLGICDAVAVMNGGRVAGIQRRPFDRDELSSWYTTRQELVA
ncbi:simple sugar transport system ATP-binding protein [Pseudonocardia thermophila]|uniref:Simple sugar transport system ATP-binding protein n=1 Tax=Pseudonocardia thermophila TaxID=1848 RepID=A0A1M6Y313_PSETH|nr:simple sugar transport system ATP-binding protein [Pseudonocardia thermophila]